MRIFHKFISFRLGRISSLSLGSSISSFFRLIHTQNKKPSFLNNLNHLEKEFEEQVKSIILKMKSPKNPEEVISKRIIFDSRRIFQKLFRNSPSESALLLKKIDLPIEKRKILEWTIWGSPPSEKFGSFVSVMILEEKKEIQQEYIKEITEMWKIQQNMDLNLFRSFLKGFCLSDSKITFTEKDNTSTTQNLSQLVSNFVQMFWATRDIDRQFFLKFLIDFTVKDIPEVAQSKSSRQDLELDFSFHGFLIQTIGKIITIYSEQWKLLDEDIGGIMKDVLNPLLISQRARNRYRNVQEDQFEIIVASNLIASVAHFMRNEKDPHDRHLVEHLLKVCGSVWTIDQFEHSMILIRSLIKDPTDFKSRLKSIFGAFGPK